MSQATVLPFRAIRYNLAKVDDLSKVIAPPYDVIGPEQQKALYESSPHNIAWLDVTKDGGGQPTEERYAKAATDFQEWQDNGVLQRDETPAIYVYEQTFTSPEGERFIRRGFYGLRRIEAFGEGKVFPHEKTLAGPKKDRLSLMKATDTQMSPIFGLFHEPTNTAGKLLAEAVQADPLFAIKDDSQQEHKLWAVTDPEWIEALQNSVANSSFLIADGHHRYETALAYSQWRDENRPNPESRYVLMFCESVDDPGLLVLPTHRVVKNRTDFSAADFLAKLKDFFTLEEFTADQQEAWVAAVHAGQDKAEHTFGIYLKGDNTRYVARIASSDLTQIPILQQTKEPLRSLDAAILHKCFLESFLGFTAADQEDTEFLNYLKSEDVFLERLQSPESQVGILMNAAPLPQIRTVAEAGQFMPPKTTYFYPKLPTGLVINKID